MNKAPHAARESACEIRFGQVGLAQVRIRTTDPQAIHDELVARVKAAPQLFERTAVCLDLSALSAAAAGGEQGGDQSGDQGGEPSAADIRALLAVVRRAGMLPVGLAHGTATVDALAGELELPVLTQFRAQPRTASPAAPAPPPAPTEVPELATPTLMHHHPVRSGQRVYARHRDLVVTTAVGAGAEVMADGCVHIYGTLRGRAMAGARGEVTARVFCHQFHAELVSIAGVFRVFETLPPELIGKPVQAWLDGDDLRFARIGG